MQHTKNIDTDTDIVSYYMPTKYRYHYWMDQYVDWMLFRDTRWLEAKITCTTPYGYKTFTQGMLIELLAHPLHHPNCTELYLMKSKDNVIGF